MAGPLNDTERGSREKRLRAGLTLIPPQKARRAEVPARMILCGVTRLDASSDL